ncbi:uncharacterized protein V1518DRAFT_421121 [Limtongia smithiae]|uniref:uncharacterized protein n=1 Tax=Limtongia smithiae TaxID=1125753 RepID=UPI0034CE8297
MHCFRRPDSDLFSSTTPPQCTSSCSSFSSLYDSVNRFRASHHHYHFRRPSPGGAAHRVNYFHPHSQIIRARVPTPRGPRAEELQLTTSRSRTSRFIGAFTPAIFTATSPPQQQQQQHSIAEESIAGENVVVCSSMQPVDMMHESISPDRDDGGKDGTVASTVVVEPVIERGRSLQRQRQQHSEPIPPQSFFQSLMHPRNHRRHQSPRQRARRMTDESDTFAAVATATIQPQPKKKIGATTTKSISTAHGMPRVTDIFSPYTPSDELAINNEPVITATSIHDDDEENAKELNTAEMRKKLRDYLEESIEEHDECERARRAVSDAKNADADSNADGAMSALSPVSTKKLRLRAHTTDLEASPTTPRFTLPSPTMMYATGTYLAVPVASGDHENDEDPDAKDSDQRSKKEKKKQKKKERQARRQSRFSTLRSVFSRSLRCTTGVQPEMIDQRESASVRGDDTYAAETTTQSKMDKKSSATKQGEEDRSKFPSFCSMFSRSSHNRRARQRAAPAARDDNHKHKISATNATIRKATPRENAEQDDAVAADEDEDEMTQDKLRSLNDLHAQRGAMARFRARLRWPFNSTFRRGERRTLPPSDSDSNDGDNNDSSSSAEQNNVDRERLLRQTDYDPNDSYHRMKKELLTRSTPTTPTQRVIYDLARCSSTEIAELSPGTQPTVVNNTPTSDAASGSTSTSARPSPVMRRPPLRRETCYH